MARTTKRARIQETPAVPLPAPEFSSWCKREGKEAYDERVDAILAGTVHIRNETTSALRITQCTNGGDVHYHWVRVTRLRAIRRQINA